MRRLLPGLGYRCGGAVATGVSSSVDEADQLCGDGLDVGGTGVDSEVIREVAVNEAAEASGEPRKSITARLFSSFGDVRVTPDGDKRGG